MAFSNQFLFVRVASKSWMGSHMMADASCSEKRNGSAGCHAEQGTRVSMISTRGLMGLFSFLEARFCRRPSSRLQVLPPRTLWRVKPLFTDRLWRMQFCNNRPLWGQIQNQHAFLLMCVIPSSVEPPAPDNREMPRSRRRRSLAPCICLLVRHRWPGKPVWRRTGRVAFRRSMHLCHCRDPYHLWTALPIAYEVVFGTRQS